MAKIVVLCCFIILAAFGSVHGSSKKQEVGFYELKKGDISMKFTNWGAAIVSLILPDKHGKLTDIVLGFDSTKEYQTNAPNFGALVGRVANRIGGAQFTLNGTHYKLIANDGNNTLHGGPKGFGHVVWKVKKHSNEGHTPHIVFTYYSVDGDQGFPGALLATVRYALIGNNQLSITMKAKALNKPTPVNLAQHAYWNLNGHNSGDILSNVIQIFGSQITLLDSHLIPTGKFESVKGTPYDFLEPHPIKSKINGLANGYDINYVLDDGVGYKLKRAAVVHDPKSGRVLELSTNAPGVQFYTSNTLDIKGKGGFEYKPFAALCLETQAFPDSVNHPNFPSTIVSPGKPYKHYMLFKFSTN